MSADDGTQKKDNMRQLKYKKIPLKDLEFTEGDTFLERGQFGDVKRARWNEKVVAVKFYSSQDRKGGFSEELVVLSLLQKHPQIVELHGACVSDHPFIVLEFAPLSLEKVLHECQHEYKYTADHMMNWAHQTATGLEYIHNKEMVHRDIKPSNILLFDSGRQLKLCDFGTAKKLEHTLTNAVGTIRYMAPEVIRGRYYTDACDVFSFAIVVWEMITRQRPVLTTVRGNISNMAILYQMANGARPPMIRNLPKAISEMVTKCWDEEPHKRPNMTEIRKKLSKLCEQFYESNKPLIPMPRDRRSGSAETSQSDRFIQEGRKTQHERPSAQEGRGSGGRKEDKSAEEGIEGPLVKDAMNSQEREQKDADKLVSPGPPAQSAMMAPSDTTLPSSDIAHPSDTAFSSGADPAHGRMRSYTTPDPNRPDTLGQDGQQHRGTTVFSKQISSPEVQYPTTRQNYPPYAHAISEGSSITPSGILRHEQWYNQGGGTYTSADPLQREMSYLHQESTEECVIQSELTSEQEQQFVQQQKQRYQEYEAVMMGKRRTSVQKASPGSPYAIPGFDKEWQPIVPYEDDPNSVEIYRQYKAVAEQVIRANQEYEELRDENEKLDREIRQDEEKLKFNQSILQEFQARSNEKDVLMNELQELNKQLEELRARSTHP